MKILAIESSCDETSAAVVEKSGEEIKVLSNITATSLEIHAGTGGIIPENAARMQVKYIMPVIIEALQSSGLDPQLSVKGQSVNQLTGQQKTHRQASENGKLETDNSLVQQILRDQIDAIAVTYGPGLIGSLLVGVETAKTLSFVFNKPIIPVNHLLAHLFANFISCSTSSYSLATSPFPFIGLIVSGGHTDLLLFEGIENYKWLGGTRDDAAGEALDKIGRLLGLSYPAGPEIERRARLGSKTKIRFHAPLLGEKTYDFSFSGLKTEAMRYIQKQSTMNHELLTNSSLINEICFAVQKAVIDVLVRKTLSATQEYDAKNILLGGGVSANNTLREAFKQKTKDQGLKTNIFAPQQKYCTDNAAMVGTYALLHQELSNWENVSVNPELYFA
ncbi:MAG: tRNA (adenosine(37)-N6)-threonylcarbamoyltransferase complex transferase subunit TsaD [Candidatus Levyibacteriota bacterium]